MKTEPPLTLADKDSPITKMGIAFLDAIKLHGSTPDGGVRTEDVLNALTNLLGKIAACLPEPMRARMAADVAMGLLKVAETHLAERRGEAPTAQPMN